MDRVLNVKGNGTKKQQLLVISNRFEENVGGAIYCHFFNITLKGNTFIENSGALCGAILSAHNLFNSSHNHYNNNVAHSKSGAAIVAVMTSYFIISNDIFDNSTILISAKQQKTIAVIDNTKITQNSGFTYSSRNMAKFHWRHKIQQ